MNGVVLVVVVFTGCGSGDGATGIRAGSSGVDSTTSSLQDPPPRSRHEFPTPPTVDPTALQRNENQRDGGLGSMCWALWEIARSFLEGLMEPGHAEVAIARFIERAPQVEAHVREILDSLPAELRPFGERFVSDLMGARKYAAGSQDEAAQQRWERVSAFFDYDNYPGAQEYVDAAEAHAACVMR